MRSGRVCDAEVSLEDRAGHGKALFLVWVSLETGPPVAAHHDGDLCAGCGVLSLDGGAVEDDAQCALGVLLEGDGLGDEVAEAFDGEQVGIVVVEVDGHDGHKRGQQGVAEGRDDDVVVFSSLVGVGLRVVGQWRAALWGLWTYTCDDLDLLPRALCHLERGHGAVEPDVNVAGLLHGVLQPVGKGLQAVLEGEHAGLGERLGQGVADVDFAVQGLGGVDVVRVRQDLLPRAGALGLHAEEAAEGSAIAALELPGHGEQGLGAELPDVAGVDAMEDGGDDVVGQPLVDAAFEEGANGLVAERGGARGLQGLFDHAQDAVEDARAPQRDEVANAGRLGGQAVEAVGVVDEAVLRAGLGALGGDDVVDEAQLFNLRPSARVRSGAVPCQPAQLTRCAVGVALRSVRGPASNSTWPPGTCTRFVLIQPPVSAPLS